MSDRTKYTLNSYSSASWLAPRKKAPLALESESPLRPLYLWLSYSPVPMRGNLPPFLFHRLLHRFTHLRISFQRHPDREHREGKVLRGEETV